MTFIRSSACVLALGIVTFAGTAHALATLEPHRAAYRLKLDKSHGMSGIAGVSGGLVIEWQRACDGWLSHQRLGFIAETDAGPEFTHDVRFSSWEATDGSKMRYTVRSFDGDRLREEYMGEANLDESSGGGTAVFTKPDRREVTLPPGTVFPARHFNQVLATANDGDTFISHEVFDGWGYDALTQVTSVIGNLRHYEPSNDRELPSNADIEAWPVSMAYYSLKERSDLPGIRSEIHAHRGRRPAGIAFGLRRLSPEGDLVGIRAVGRTGLLIFHPPPCLLACRHH